MKRQQRYPSEFRTEAVKLVTEQGVSQKEAAKPATLMEGGAQGMAGIKRNRWPACRGIRNRASAKDEGRPATCRVKEMFLDDHGIGGLGREGDVFVSEQGGFYLPDFFGDLP